MKNFLGLKSAFLIVVSFTISISAQSFFYPTGRGENESHTILVVNRDGSCVLTNQVIESRKSLELQITAWERYSKMSESGDDEDGAAASPVQPTKSDQKQLTNEELVSKIRDMYQQRSDAEQGHPDKIESVEVASNTVQLLTTRSYASLKELLGQSPYMWGPNILMFEDVRAETDTNRNLRLTFIPNPATSRHAKTASRQWKSSSMKFEWKLVLPGKILSSGLPNTQESATWLKLYSDQPDTIEAATKLIGTQLVITAECPDIKLAEPLESKKLVRAGGKHRSSEPDLPITEAGPGFLAEPIGVSLSTIHFFPDGESYFKSRPELSMSGMSPTGMLVAAKLFPPKGREIRNVSDVRVTSARDDQGRAIPGNPESAENEQSSLTFGISYYPDSGEFETDASNESGRIESKRIQLRMGLPPSDAKAIEELQVQAVVVTTGGWKEMVLTNIQADAKKEIELGEIFPGAKLIVKKISGKKAQRTIQASVEGPKEVSRIEVRVKFSSSRSGQSTMDERESRTSGDKTTRSVTIQASQFDMAGQSESDPLTLLIRYPKDLKRERVEFKLTGLDLL